MLTDIAIKRAKPGKKPRKLADTGGLYLYISTNDARSWRYDFRLAGRRGTVVLGRYPELSLKVARDRLKAARELVEAGKNPATEKRRERVARATEGRNTFKGVAEDWLKELSPHRSRAWWLAHRGRLKNYIYSRIGLKPIKEVEPADILAVVRYVAECGHPRQAEGCRQTISMIFAYAVRNLRAKHNPAREVQGAIELPPIGSHRPLKRAEIPEFLQRIANYTTGRAATRLAIRLLMLTFVRKSELLNMPRSELNLEKAEWRIAASRMKLREEHVVPLSTQAVALFREALAIAPESPYVFPNDSDPSKPMNGYTLNVAFRQMGYTDFVPHGLRSTASTLLNEAGFRADVIERQLDHVERQRVRATYNRAEYLEERRRMMQAYADLIDGIDATDVVVPIKGKKTDKR